MSENRNCLPQTTVHMNIATSRFAMKTRPPNAFHAFLRECYQRPHPLCRVQRRSISSDSAAFASSDASPRNIAVLGGGITGLTAAYLLSHKLPKATITLFETKDRLAGWLRSTEIDVEGGRVLFEHGPRTLRPSGASGMATLDLVRSVLSPRMIN